MGEKHSYNRRANEGVMIEGGRQAIAARHRWLDEGVRVDRK